MQDSLKPFQPEEAEQHAENAEHLSLDEHEKRVSDAAAEVLTGLARRDEKEAFEESLDRYEEALLGAGTSVIEGIRQDGGDITDVKEGLIGLLMQSKADIITDASFQHEQDSVIESMRHRLSGTRVGRLAVRAAAGAVSGAAVYATLKGVDAAFQSEAGGVLGFVAGMKAPLLFKSFAKTSGGKIRSLGVDSVVRHDFATTREIMAEVASVTDEEERNMLKHELLTDRFHLSDTRTALRDILAPAKLEGEGALSPQALVGMAVHVATESISGFFGIDREAKDEVEETLRNSIFDAGSRVALEANTGVLGNTVKGLVDGLK